LIGEQYGGFVRPRDLTRLWYEGDLREDIAPVRCGRRDIPETYVQHVASAVIRRGMLRRGKGVA
jgi:hypothetical protein